MGNHVLDALLRERGFQIISGSSSYSRNPFVSLIFRPPLTPPVGHGSIMTPAPDREAQDLSGVTLPNSGLSPTTLLRLDLHSQNIQNLE